MPRGGGVPLCLRQTVCPLPRKHSIWDSLARLLCEDSLVLVCFDLIEETLEIKRRHAAGALTANTTRPPADR